MQLLKGKKVWFLLGFGVLLAATAGIWLFGKKDEKAYANGRIVEEPEKSVECEEWRAA